MIPFFPKQIGNRAIAVYLVSLATVSIAFLSYSMPIGYIALGCMWVLGFFFLVYQCSLNWRVASNKVYVRNIFYTALALRIVWVIVSYFFYISVTGVPFEFGAADSQAYHADAEWLADSPWSVTWAYLFGNYIGISDSGFNLILSIIYRIFGPSIIIARFINAILSALTCILVYKMSSRTFGEEVGRMAGIMMVFMPNLIIYCGYTLKESVMIFLVVACLNRIEYLTHHQKTTIWDIILPSLLAGSLFLFRTAIGSAAVFAFASTILVSSAPSMKRGGKRIALIAWGILALLVFGGGTLATEVESLWEGRNENQSNRRLEQTLRGNRWAQYATGAVMAPMVFVLPFATMVDTEGQEGQQAKSGGNYIRNFMGFFTILAIYEAFRRKRWRDFVPIGAFVISYLGVVSMSAFAGSERFLLPGLPCLIMMWAYGVSTLRANTYRLLTPWCFVVVAMEVAWAVFKLGSRSLIF